jgi:hypothetical protein
MGDTDDYRVVLALGHIAKEAQEDLQDAFNTFDGNFYEQLVNERTRSLEGSPI